MIVDLHGCSIHDVNCIEPVHLDEIPWIYDTSSKSSFFLSSLLMINGQVLIRQ